MVSTNAVAWSLTVAFAAGVTPARAQTTVGQSVADLGVGDVSADVVFTPVAPCRLIDTRNAGGAFGMNEIRNYDLIGPSNYSSLGGFNGSCNIPSDRTPVTATTSGNTVRALVLSFVATGAGGNGHLTAWPSNQAMPNASILNYGTSLYAVANGVAVATCDATAVPPADPCPNDLSILAGTSGTHLVVDVLGYYTPQRYVLASNRTEFGVFAVDFPASAGGQNGIDAISFHPPLAVAPTPNFIPFGGSSTTNCPGTGANPLAAPGQFCLYETSTLNVSSRLILKQLGGWVAGAADPIGATYIAIAAVSGRTWSVGVWAVTAP